MADIRRARRVLVLLLLLALLVAACGDDGGADTEIAVGNTAPDFSLPAADGTTVALSDYDDPVLLFFHMADG